MDSRALSEPPSVIRRVPFLAVASGAVLLAFAATRFPGGYEWSRHTVSALFQPATPEGVINPGRWPAAAGVVCMATGIGVIFRLLAREATSRVHREALGIGGVGSMVYAALTVTPMHDLMVSIALLFFVPAALALLHLLYSERRFGLFWLGVACLASHFNSAVIYYGDISRDLLPLGQKLSMTLCLSWLFAVHFRARGEALTKT